MPWGAPELELDALRHLPLPDDTAAQNSPAAVVFTREWDAALPGDETSSLESRVKALEAALKKEAEAAAKKKTDDALKPTQRWTGRIHADYWGFPHTSPGAN